MRDIYIPPPKVRRLWPVRCVIISACVWTVLLAPFCIHPWEIAGGAVLVGLCAAFL